MLASRQTPRDPDGIDTPVVGSPDYTAHGTMPVHRHSCHQLIYTVVGAIHMTTAQGEWVLPPGRALWIAAHTDHILTARRPAETRVLYIQPGAPGVPNWYQCRVVEISPFVRELVFVRARQPWDYPRQSPQARIAHVLLEQLSELPQVPANLALPSDPRALRMVDLLKNDPANRDTLAQLAVQAGASPRTIERLFCAQTGMSFGTWRHRYRLLVALEQLAAGESVTNVALTVGYETPSSFIAAFRAIFGVTPARYFNHSTA